MSHEKERITFIELHKSGMKTVDIVRTTGYKQSTAYDAVKRYKKIGGTADRPRSSRPANLDNARKHTESSGPLAKKWRRGWIQQIQRAQYR